MNEVADRNGFLVVYPNGTGWAGLPPRSWNAGTCCSYAMGRGVDDVGFIRALVDHLTQAYPIDAHRIYVTGISNGGMMAYRLGCELSDVLAAIAPVAGALVYSPCRPSRRLAVIVVHGTADRHVFYDGGVSPLAQEMRVDPPVARAVSFWVDHNKCTRPPLSERDGPLAQERYTGCREGAEVVLYTVAGGGHVWPGGNHGWHIARQPAHGLSASEVIWDFFARHPRR